MKRWFPRNRRSRVFVFVAGFHRAEDRQQRRRVHDERIDLVVGEFLGEVRRRLVDRHVGRAVFGIIPDDAQSELALSGLVRRDDGLFLDIRLDGPVHRLFDVWDERCAPRSLCEP